MKSDNNKLKLIPLFLLQVIIFFILYEGITAYFNRRTDFVGLAMPIMVFSYLILLFLLYVIDFFVDNKKIVYSIIFGTTLAYLIYSHNWLIAYPNRWKLLCATVIFSTILKLFIFKIKKDIPRHSDGIKAK